MMSYSDITDWYIPTFFATAPCLPRLPGVAGHVSQQVGRVQPAVPHDPTVQRITGLYIRVDGEKRKGGRRGKGGEERGEGRKGGRGRKGGGEESGEGRKGGRGRKGGGKERGRERKGRVHY